MLAGLVNESFLGEYNIKVIYNGIDTEVFKHSKSSFRERHDLEGKRILLGVATAWNHRKGLLEFIELSKKLGEEYKIVLVGLSQKQIKSLPNDIIGIERTNSTKELAEIYSTADVFMNLSVEETFGMTTIEAISCGTPVIVYKKTATSEIVPDDCGVKVDYRITDLSREQIERLLQESFKKRDSISSYNQVFSKTKMIKDYIMLFEEKSGV